MRQIGKALRKKDGKKQFVSLEESARNRANHRVGINNLLKTHQFITVRTLVEQGWDLSVARRALKEMEEDGQICAEHHSSTWTQYSALPPNQLKKAWRTQWFDFETDYRPNYF